MRPVSAGSFPKTCWRATVCVAPRDTGSRPTTVAWTLLADGDAESIGSEVAAGHPEAACGLLLNRAIELLSLAAALPETTLPA